MQLAQSQLPCPLRPAASFRGGPVELTCCQLAPSYLPSHHYYAVSGGCSYLHASLPHCYTAKPGDMAISLLLIRKHNPVPTWTHPNKEKTTSSPQGSRHPLGHKRSLAT
jgi:hypothetical protein